MFNPATNLSQAGTRMAYIDVILLREQTEQLFVDSQSVRPILRLLPCCPDAVEFAVLRLSITELDGSRE
jgi:hypothetical protein